jgi:hypothetical protein
MWLLLLLAGGLGTAALLAAIAESERRRELPAPPEKPPSRLLTSAAVHVTTRDVMPHTTYPHTLCQLAIPLGEEVFSPPLPCDKFLKLVITGAIGTRVLGYKWSGIDACFKTDENLNYRVRHSDLLIDGKSPGKDPFEEDRADHRYAFPYRATGGRLAVLLESRYTKSNKDVEITGDLQLAIMPLTLTEEVVLGFRSTESKERKQQEKVSQRALELAVLAHVKSNFLDPEYQNNYAKKFTRKVLDREGPEWQADYHEVLKDDALAAVLTEQHPHVFPFLEARLEVIRNAERFDAEPDPEPPVSLAPEQQRHKETPQEWRERRLRHLRNNAEHKIAKMLERFESLRRLREQAEQMGLDEEVIERLEQELMGDIQDDEDEHNQGYKQLG